MRLWWLLLALLATSLAVKANKNDEDGAVSEEDEEVEEEKEKFTPSQFVRPEVKTGTLHLFEFFAERTVLGPKWVKSTAKKEGVDDGIAKYNGEWEISTGTADVAIVDDFGLVAKSKARHHAIASRLATPFRFDAGKPLVVQYEVKYEEGQECGGGYVKLLTEGAEKELANFQDRTDYTVMFGPDKCGANGKVHLIFKFKNPKNGTISEHAAPSDGAKSHLWDDHNTHLYTLIVNPDNSYSVSVDESTLSSGNILKDLVPAIEPPKEIPDPDDKKPADWDERETIEDETAEKPDDWDEDAPKEVVDEKAVKPDDWLEDEEAYVPDPTAKKPDDWDVEMDGEWEAPLIENEACKGRSGCGKWKPPTIPNPNYKGKWRRPQIPNPAYKGVWKARLVDNKNYYEPRGFADLQSISAVGFELWTMSANIIFDNILITDSSTAAAEAAALTYRIRVAEAKRLAQALGKEGNFWDAFIPDKDKPWLWAVYVLVILLPTIFIGVYCFGNKSTPVDSTKKTDEVVPDDEEEVPNLVGDEEEEEAAEEQRTEEAEEVKDEEEEQSSRHSSKSRSRSRSTSRSPSRKAAPLDEHSTEPSTSTVTKRRQRRQD